MKRTFIKTIFRDFKRNLSRLIAIIAIMALGVGFLIGLLSSTPDLQDSVEHFYDSHAMQDVLIKSTLGFSKSDMDSLKKDIDEIDNIEGFSSLDYEIKVEDVDITARVITTLMDSKVNQMDLLEGELPKSKEECLVQNLGFYYDKNCIGSSVRINEQEYKIVGICNSPVYFYKMQEPATIGKGSVDAFFYLDAAYTDYTITDIAITIKGAEAYNSFKKEYFRYIDPVKTKLKDVSAKYLELRLENLKEEAYQIALDTYAPSSPFEIEMIQQMIEKEFQDRDCTWYVLDRKSNMSYVTYEENSEKVNRVAVIFPFFFFFLSALIALTSVTRLIYEDRFSIGTLKSLGYSKLRILNKYFIYALFACIIGSVSGLFLGVYGLPYVIYVCYNSLFVMPECYLSWYTWAVVLASVSMSVTIFAVMIAVCLKALNEKPNALLVPKAPKAGKRILLERIGFFWKRLKFKYKSSIRNIFRFKRNLIMMIVGVGGCTGLMLVGLGLNESITSLSKKQFQEIMLYDFSLTIEKEVEIDYLSDSTWMYFYKEESRMNKDEDYEVELFYTDNNIFDFMNLNTKVLPKNEVLVSSQIASIFHLRKGSQIDLMVGEEIKSFIVGGIFENYVSNYVIASKDLLPDQNNNRMLLKLGTKDLENYDEIVRRIYASEEFISIEDVSQTKSIYSSMTNSMGLVIALVIVFSGLLAIVVIYTLTNININERIKEIATLKVLGYHRKEVLGYIYREIITMSILGILFGFILGPLLNYFVMNKISSPGLSFSTHLGGLYFLYSFLITMVFVFFVLILFIPKMKKIKMVESLKSVE